MYTMVERRKITVRRCKGLVQRAQSEFFPNAVPISAWFYPVSDEANSINTVVIVFDRSAVR